MEDKTGTLTINLGIRYDFITNPTEATGLLYRITTLDPYTCSNNPACGTPEPGISGGPTDPTGYTHESHYFEHNPSAHNIDPRIGLAWDIFGDHKTSFRSGFGLFPFAHISSGVHTGRKLCLSPGTSIY